MRWKTRCDDQTLRKEPLQLCAATTSAICSAQREGFLAARITGIRLVRVRVALVPDVREGRKYANDVGAPANPPRDGLACAIEDVYLSQTLEHFFRKTACLTAPSASSTLTR